MKKRIIKIILSVITFLLAINLYLCEKPYMASAIERNSIEASEEDLSLFAVTWKEEIVSRLRSMRKDYGNTLELSELQISVDVWDDVKNVMQDEMSSSPDYFYVNPNQYTYFTSNQTLCRIEFAYHNDYIYSDGTIKQSALKADRLIINRSIEDIMAGIQPGMSDLEKALWVHDWMVRELDYALVELNQQSTTSRIFNIVGVFADRKAVCDGYSKAYSMMMQKLGIPVRNVVSESMNHSWNMIQIEGDWYHVDVTWDDPLAGDTEYGQGNQLLEGRVTHKYFLKSDKEFMDLSHYGWASNAPAAKNSTSFPNYIFRTHSETCFYYKEGYWFFNEGNKIIKSTLDGAGRSEQVMSEAAVFMHGLGDSLFYASSKKVYQLTYSNYASEGLNTQVYQTKNNDSIKEFTIQDGYLHIYTKGSAGYGKQLINARNLIGEIAITEATDHPAITWVNAVEMMMLGEKRTFSYQAVGYDVSDITWRTERSKRVTVAKNMGKETAVVTATSTGTDVLYLKCGDNIILKLTIIVVGKPTVKWTEMTQTMKVGEKKTFVFTSAGYDVEEIVWKTSKAKIVTVSKNQGKIQASVTASNIGTDTLYLQYGQDKILKLVVKVV